MAESSSNATECYPRVRRFVGGALAGVAAISLLVSIVAVYQTWSLRGQVARGLDGGIAILVDALATGDRALADLDSQLVVARDSLATVEKASQILAGTMGATSDSLRTSSTIVGTDLPAAVTSTQAAIQNARPSARLVDDVLGTLAGIPLLGVDYRPAVPLSDDLGNMASSLDRLPVLARELGKQLDSTAAGLDGAQVEAEALSESLRSAREGLAESRDAIAELRLEIGDSRALVERLRQDVPAGVTWLAIGLTFVLAWLTAVQAAALTLGLEWLLAGGSEAPAR